MGQGDLLESLLADPAKGQKGCDTEGKKGFHVFLRLLALKPRFTLISFSP